MTRRSPLALVALVVFAVVSVAACKGREGPPKDQFPIVGDAARVQLLTPGAGTTRLRWKPMVGSGQRVQIDIATQSTVKAQGQTIPVKLDMHMTCDARVVAVKPDGAFTSELVFQDFSLDMPQLASAGADPSMVRDLLRGAKMTMDLDPQGHVTHSSFTADNPLLSQLGDMQKQLDDSLGSLTFPFPDEPVGVGSKWDTYATQKAGNGLEMRVVTHYELLSLDGDKGKVKFTVEQYADPQPLTMGMGATAKLESMTSTGSGETDFDLGKPLVAATDSRLGMDLEVEARVGGESAQMKMRTDLTITAKVLGPAPAAALRGDR